MTFLSTEEEDEQANSVFLPYNLQRGWHWPSWVRHGLGLAGERGTDCLRPVWHAHRGSCLDHQLEGKKATSADGDWNSAVFTSPPQPRRKRWKHGKAYRRPAGDQCLQIGSTSAERGCRRGPKSLPVPPSRCSSRQRVSTARLWPLVSQPLKRCSGVGGSFVGRSRQIHCPRLFLSLPCLLRVLQTSPSPALACRLR